MFGRQDKNKNFVTLSTVHKAKGLEWHTVYILQPFSVPIRKLAEGSEVPEWERIQEQNVAYVAVTRASRELLFLKHVKDLKDSPAKIVEVFGEEHADSTSDEQWWDEQQRRGTFNDSEDPSTNVFNLDVNQAVQLLQIRGEAEPTAAEINAAFKKKALIFHPDKVDQHLRVAYTEQFKKINAAKELLLARLAGEKRHRALGQT